jgi:hypothetical protein
MKADLAGQHLCEHGHDAQHLCEHGHDAQHLCEHGHDAQHLCEHGHDAQIVSGYQRSYEVSSPSQCQAFCTPQMSSLSEARRPQSGPQWGTLAQARTLPRGIIIPSDVHAGAQLDSCGVQVSKAHLYQPMRWATVLYMTQIGTFFKRSLNKRCYPLVRLHSQCLL